MVLEPFRPTSQVDAGSLAGAVDAYSLIEEVKNDLDSLAFLLSSAVNEQPKRGKTSMEIQEIYVFSIWLERRIKSLC